MYGQGGMSCDSDNNVSTIASFGPADEALVGVNTLQKRHFPEAQL